MWLEGSLLVNIKSVLGQLATPWDDVTSQGCREGQETPEKTFPLENMEEAWPRS